MECIHIQFLLSSICALIATVLSNNRDLLINIFTRTFVIGHRFERKKPYGMFVLIETL